MNIMLIGLGRWGEKHLRVLQEIGCGVWVADIAQERLHWAIGRGVDRSRAVPDYTAALDAVDAVDVVTTVETHLPIAERALAAGRHCFIEKPLAVSVAEGQRLVDASRATGRILQVGHIFRFHPVTAVLHEVLAAGRIGRVRFATGRFSGFKRPRTDVGVTHTDAIHYFDLFAHLFGTPATAVSGLQRDYLGRGLDDLSLTIVHYGDVPAVIEANYFVPGTHRECVIVGETGSLVADYGTSSVTLYSGEHRQRGAAWEAIDTGKEELRASGSEPLKLELEAFREACAGRRPSPVSGEDGVSSLRVVEAAARAAQLGRTVMIEEIR